MSLNTNEAKLLSALTTRGSDAAKIARGLDLSLIHI